MERPERPSRHSKNHDKWKRIIQPAGDSDSSSDWSSDSDLRSHVRYFSGSEPTSEASGSNRNTFECTSVNLQPSTSNASYSLDLRSMFSMEKRKRASENPDLPGTSNNSHLLHHDYAVGDSFKTSSGVESYGWPWYVRPGSARKRVRFSLPVESQGRDDTELDLELPPDLSSILSPRQLTVTGLTEILPATADSKHGLVAKDEPTDVASMIPLLAMRRRELEMRTMNWGRKYTEVMAELQSVSAPGTRPDPEASEVQVISMAGPSTSGIKRAAPSSSHSGLDPNEEVIIVEDQQQSDVPVLVLDPVLPAPKGKAGGSTEEESINQQLISLLECPVCMEYMRPPIQQCRRGHLVCALCKPKLQACPTCRSRLSDSRNLAMEKVADKLQYPCKNASDGCSDQPRLCEKENHEANCDYRSYRCCFAQCDWKGFHKNVLAHYSVKHSEKLLFGNEQTIRVDLGELSMAANQNWIISTLDELFRVNFITIKAQPRASIFDTGSRLQIFGCIQFVGPCEKANNFRYKLESRKMDGGLLRSAVFKRTTHNDLKKCISAYTGGDSFCLRGDTAELLSDRTQGEVSLLVSLKIQPMSEVTAIV